MVYLGFVIFICRRSRVCGIYTRTGNKGFVVAPTCWMSLFDRWRWLFLLYGVHCAVSGGGYDCNSRKARFWPLWQIAAGVAGYTESLQGTADLRGTTTTSQSGGTQQLCGALGGGISDG